jgi:nucleoprotein TPR
MKLSIKWNSHPPRTFEAVITNNLVLCCSTHELQDQNQELLKIVRELGAKMKAEEQDYCIVTEKG